MSQKLTKMTLISALAVSLSGCAQLSYLGDSVWGHTKNAWGHTKSAANYVARPVTKLLRVAPQPQYVFEDTSRAQNMAKQAFRSYGRPDISRDIYARQRVQLPVPQTPKYQAQSYAAPHYQNGYRAPSAAPRRVAEAQAVAPRAEPQVSSDISFVKMGGGSNMHDWTACERQAQGFVRIVKGGYIIDPAFESCMRAKGYKPESEVINVMNAEQSL